MASGRRWVPAWTVGGVTGLCILVSAPGDHGPPPVVVHVAESPLSSVPRPPNEPPGFRTIAQVPFDGVASPLSALPEGLRLALPPEWEAIASEDLGVDVDVDAPGSPPYVGRATFPRGLGDGVSPIWMQRKIDASGFRQIFVSFWFKLSDNWQGHATGVNKIGFAWMHGKPVLTFAAVGSGVGPLVSQIRLQDVRYERARNLTSNMLPTPLKRGTWHRWEMLLVSNRPDMRDGEIRWWIDGALAGDYGNVVLAGPEEDDVWEIVTWRPVWGGRGDQVRQTMYMWMDDLYVSGEEAAH